MQHVFKPEFVLRPGYFKHIKENQRPECQWEPERYPAPTRKIGPQPNVNTQYADHPQNRDDQGQANKSVCLLVAPFGEPKEQGKI